MYLDGFRIFLSAKVLAPGPCTSNPPHSVMETVAWEQPWGPSPSRALPRASPCPVLARCASQGGSAGTMAWQGEDRAASWTPQARGPTRGETWLRSPHFFHTQRDYSKVLPYGPWKIPARTGFGRPAPEQERTRGGCRERRGLEARAVPRAGPLADSGLGPGACRRSEGRPAGCPRPDQPSSPSAIQGLSVQPSGTYFVEINRKHWFPGALHLECSGLASGV